MKELVRITNMKESRSKNKKDIFLKWTATYIYKKKSNSTKWYENVTGIYSMFFSVFLIFKVVCCLCACCSFLGNQISNRGVVSELCPSTLAGWCKRCVSGGGGGSRHTFLSACFKIWIFEKCLCFFTQCSVQCEFTLL